MFRGLETFAKVRAVHDRTDSPGEKAAAAGRMEALAKSAGMTVAEAVSKLDASATASTAGQAGYSGPSWDDLFNSPAWRKAKADADRARADSWRRVLAEYGSEEAVFAATPWEVTLARACDRFIVKRATTGWRIGSLLGWDLFSLGKPASVIMEAVRKAYPMPTNVQEAWSEFTTWDKLCRDRETRGCGAGDPKPWVRVRTDLIEHQLDTMPANGLNDLLARLDWMGWRNDLETAPDPAEERTRLATLRADIERMGSRIREQDAGKAPVQTGHQHRAASGACATHRTNAEKRRDVMALLNARDLGIGLLTDREIARRAGVSPQTVGNIRRRMRTG